MRVQKGRERRGRSAVRRTELGVARSEQTNESGHRNKRERRFQASYATRFTGHYARSPRTSVAERLCGVARSEQTNEFGLCYERERRFQVIYDATSVPRCRSTLQADYKSATRFTGHYARSERPRTSRPICCTSDRARRSTGASKRTSPDTVTNGERRFQASYDATSVPRYRSTLQADYKSATRFTGHYARSERPRTSVAERLCVGLSSA